jgi:hypothetical protein
MTCRFGILLLAVVVMLGSAACGAGDDGDKAVENQNRIEKPDGSIVETHLAPDGTKTEVRTFKDGEVFRVSRITRPSGDKKVLVEFRDNRTAVSDEESDFEQAMDATGDAIATSAKKTWDVSKDTGQDVGEKTVEGTQKAVEVGKDVGSTVGDKATDVAGKTAEVSKDVGKTVGKGAKKTGKAIKKVFN